MGPLPMIAILVGAATAGLGVWTLAEYVLHRWAFHHHHHDRIRSLVAREHRLHHRAPTRTSPLARSAAWIGVAALGVPLWWWGSTGVAVWAGWAAGYTAYDQFHWRAHHREPRRRYEVRLRARHDLHHHGHPHHNFGVTTAVWDRVFGTTVAATVAHSS